MAQSIASRTCNLPKRVPPGVPSPPVSSLVHADGGIHSILANDSYRCRLDAQAHEYPDGLRDHPLPSEDASDRAELVGLRRLVVLRGRAFRRPS